MQHSAPKVLLHFGHYVHMGHCLLLLAVQDSSIGDIVSQSVSQLVTFDFTMTTTKMATKNTMTTVTTETAI